MIKWNNTHEVTNIFIHTHFIQGGFFFFCFVGQYQFACRAFCSLCCSNRFRLLCTAMTSSLRSSLAARLRRRKFKSFRQRRVPSSSSCSSRLSRCSAVSLPMFSLVILGRTFEEQFCGEINNLRKINGNLMKNGQALKNQQFINLLVNVEIV